MRLPIVGLIFVAVLGVTSTTAQSRELLLFGGAGNKTFLGCLTCSAYDSDAVCNDYGAHGSAYQAASIWNAYGTFGSQYSTWSPWNEHTMTPPIIVDREGNSYGLFSANTSLHRRTTIDAVNKLAEAGAKTSDITRVREALCNQ